MSTVSPLPTFRRSLMQASITLLGATALGIAACGGGGGGDGGDGDGTIGNEPPLDVSQPASTAGQTTVLGAALNAPWGLAFLPDGRMLVTERAGTMALVNTAGSSVVRLSGVPAVAFDAQNQGGLLDVAYNNGWIYFTYSEPGNNNTAGTALARAQLNGAGTGLQSVQVLWQQSPKVQGVNHFGSRIAFRDDGTLYVTAGDRMTEPNNGTATADGAQSTATTIGKVVRLRADTGAAPGDNPTLGTGAAAGVLWSRGHRNPQGAAVRPGTNDLWISEHGPQGGDEINRISAGANYGWPVRSYGCDYALPPGPNCLTNGGTHAPDFSEPKVRWTPATAPSGLMFYTGNAFPDWTGNLFSGALSGQTLWRIVIDANGRTTSRQEIQAVSALGVRIRDVRTGPDGNIYLLTNGSGANANRIVRLAP